MRRTCCCYGHDVIVFIDCINSLLSLLLNSRSHGNTGYTLWSKLSVVGLIKAPTIHHERTFTFIKMAVVVVVVVVVLGLVFLFSL